MNREEITENYKAESKKNDRPFLLGEMHYHVGIAIGFGNESLELKLGIV